MKIMLVAIGTAGDVFPFIGLGRQLIQRRHEVHLLSLNQYRPFAEQAGLIFRGITGVEGASGHRDFYHPTRGMRLIASQVLLPSIRPVFQIVSQLRHEEWQIVADQVSYGVRVAQEQLHFRFTTCIVSPFMLRTTEFMPVIPGLPLPAWAPQWSKRAFYGFVSQLWDRELAPGINSFRRELGFAPTKDVLYGWSPSPHRIVGLFPEWFAPRPSDWPDRFIYGGFTASDLGTQSDQNFEEVKSPKVVFCAGSAGTAAERFFQTAIEASRGRHWTAILLAPNYRPGNSMPPNVRLNGYVPLSQILPSSAAIVHHGGLGSISCAVSSAVPQIVLPFGHDQFDNAARVEHLGIGQNLVKKQTPSALAEGIESVLENTSMKQKCRTVAEREPSGVTLQRLCQSLESEWSSKPELRPTYM